MVAQYTLGNKKKQGTIEFISLPLLQVAEAIVAFSRRDYQTSKTCVSFHQPLPHRMNKVRVGGSMAGGAHLGGHLPAVVGRVHDDMH